MLHSLLVGAFVTQPGTIQNGGNRRAANAVYLEASGALITGTQDRWELLQFFAIKEAYLGRLCRWQSGLPACVLTLLLSRRVG
jgi:hypothetical protein